MRIELNNISKKFNLGFRNNKSALGKALSLIFQKKDKEEFWALKNISFKAEAGSNIGLIGKNASGKSTLLRIIAGIYLPDQGILRTNGEIAYITGFNQGLRQKLTMRDNIYLIGSIMGLSQKNIRKRFDKIVEFSGLKDYIDISLYKFSSGMLSRLASSIGIYCLEQKNPDILLLDEVLGAGADINYQDKTLKKMEELIRGGATVILASHNLDSIRKYCDEVLWLDKGEIIARGKPDEIINQYLNKSRGTINIKTAKQNLSGKDSPDIFFIRGFVRSGTNWVCNLLNLHPEIHCTGEFGFIAIRETIESIIKTDWNLLSQKPELSSLLIEDFEKTVANCILRVEVNPNKLDIKWLGDRTPGALEPILIKEKPHFLIYRDGRDILVSWTYHLFRKDFKNYCPFDKFPKTEKKRIKFKNDPFYFKKHPEQLLDDEKWVRAVANDWNKYTKSDLGTIEKIKSGQINIPLHIIRYENLHSDIENERKKMYQFLGLIPEKALPLNDLTKPGFGREDFNSFYRKGEIGDWKNYFTKDTSKWFNQEAEDILAKLGYDKQ